MFRLARVIKVIKNKNKILGQISIYLKVAKGLESLVFLLIAFISSMHLFTCFWIMVAAFTVDESCQGDTCYTGTWLENYGDNETSLSANSSHFYSIAFYWACQTVTTVGYGDVLGKSSVERLLCAIAMIFGVIAFSIGNGKLASVIQT